MLVDKPSEVSPSSLGFLCSTTLNILTVMTSDEIKTFFRTSAMLRHCPDFDPKRADLQQTVNELQQRYISEYLSNNELDEQKPITHEPSIEDALAVIVNTCNSATNLEVTHHPNGMTDDEIKMTMTARQMAINMIANKLLNEKSN